MCSVLPPQVTPRTAAQSSIKCVQTRPSVRTQQRYWCASYNTAAWFLSVCGFHMFPQFLICNSFSCRIYSHFCLASFRIRSFSGIEFFALLMASKTGRTHYSWLACKAYNYFYTGTVLGVYKHLLHLSEIIMFVVVVLSVFPQRTWWRGITSTACVRRRATPRATTRSSLSSRSPAKPPQNTSPRNSADPRSTSRECWSWWPV